VNILDIDTRVVRTGPITNSDIWKIENGKKTWINNPSQLLKLGYSGTQDPRIEEITIEELRKIEDA
jgi:hypothetical protein